MRRRINAAAFVVLVWMIEKTFCKDKPIRPEPALFIHRASAHCVMYVAGWHWKMGVDI